MADDSHIKNRICNNSASDCQISVKFCVEKQFFV